VGEEKGNQHVGGGLVLLVALSMEELGRMGGVSMRLCKRKGRTTKIEEVLELRLGFKKRGDRKNKLPPD